MMLNDDQKTIGSIDFLKEDSKLSEKPNQSRSIGKKKSFSPESAWIASRKSVFDNKSFKSSPISSLQKNSKTFNDFASELYFPFKKSNDSIKKSSFRQAEKRVLSSLKY